MIFPEDFYIHRINFIYLLYDIFYLNLFIYYIINNYKLIYYILLNFNMVYFTKYFFVCLG